MTSLTEPRRSKMFGEYVPVRAQIADVRHFSAHADAARILDRLRGAPAPRTTRQARMP
ncbi:MBL fold metallo-hydrolase RNA specificity domain-containing protein [Streptomyces mirabilis]|uniref:MBL fold metallo-hydrolase RNA specificity domain-containing protein n=1 Tax=Streptomyces mirabilis TaxID=68239 RepID=UPI002E3105AA|nr:MBL fold metallo-hydrolase RNA specificity domain-containing protein [Streptomyces mirabilis]